MKPRSNRACQAEEKKENAIETFNENTNCSGQENIQCLDMEGLPDLRLRKIIVPDI